MLYEISQGFDNTAVDLDEDGNKLVYHRAKAGPDGHIWETAAGKEIIKLIESCTGKWVHLSARFYHIQASLRRPTHGL